MTWRVAVYPTTEPISLEEARLHLRLTTSDSPPSHPDDTLVRSLITAARQYCEKKTERSLCPQTIEVLIDAFPENEIQLPMSPIEHIESFVYVDENGDEQTLASSQYVLDNAQEPGWVLPLIDTTWPTTYGVVNAIRIRYLAGYTGPDDSPNLRPLPRSIHAAMLLLIGHWYENREAIVTGTIVTTLELAVDSLLMFYKIRMPMA